MLAATVLAKIFFYIPCLLSRAIYSLSVMLNSTGANNFNNLKLPNNFKSLRRLITSLHGSAGMRDERAFGPILQNTESMMAQVHSPCHMLL